METEITMKDLMYLFGLLLVGIVIVRMASRRGKKPPKGGRYFKRNLDE